MYMYFVCMSTVPAKKDIFMSYNSSQSTVCAITCLIYINI